MSAGGGAPVGAFKWLEKFGQVMLSIPDEETRMRFVYALVLYGATGEVMDLEWPLSSLLIACMEDVDYSKAAMAQGGKGGRPRRSTPTREGSQAPSEEERETAEDEACETAENPERGVSETAKGGFSDSQKGGFADAETHSIALHSNAKHSNAVIESTPAPAPAPAIVPAMKPPTAEEVVLFAKAQTLAVPDLEAEAAHFVDHYAAQGWVRANGMPVRDWRHLWARWVAERPVFAARGQPATNTGEARAHAALLAERYGDESRTEVIA